MFRTAREKVGMSQEEASFMLHIGRRTLSDYENSHTVTPPDVVLRMSEVYEKPELCAKYCVQYCPIGQRHAHPVEMRDLATAVLGLIKEYNDVRPVPERLICLAEDGVIDQYEFSEFEIIMNKLTQLEQRIVGLRLWSASNIGLDCMVRQKEKGLGIITKSRATYKTS